MEKETIKLSQIESLDMVRDNLSKSRIERLLDENGFLKFDELFENNTEHSDPIVIDKSASPYSIINGRHRIFIARGKGYSSVTCFVQGT